LGCRLGAHAGAAVPTGHVLHEPPGLPASGRVGGKGERSPIGLCEGRGSHLNHQYPPAAEARACRSRDSCSRRPQTPASWLSGGWTYRLVVFPTSGRRPWTSPELTSGRAGGWTIDRMALVTAWVWRSRPMTMPSPVCWPIFMKTLDGEA